MKRREFLGAAAVLASVPSGAQPPAPAATGDPRNVRNGFVIPDEGYCDQPYIVITDDGNWLCVLTTGKGVEGEFGQHIVSTISTDKGKTWTPTIDIEPASGPEASWVMPLKVPGGRVYVFYTYNKDNLRSVKSNSAGLAKRVDTMGAYMFKYSDDNGRTWSAERYEIPMRLMRIDRENTHEGKVLFFWGVGKPIIDRKSAYVGFAKVGRWGNPGAMIESQGCFLRSDNILTERDPKKIKWELLPDGDEGLRAPKGPVSDEANLVALSDGSLYATYRTIDGYNCGAYSRDGGHTWTPPEYALYSPGGRRVKHPRAANFVKKFSNGKFLLWYHNQGGEVVHQAKWDYYTGRNPAWITGGVERNGHIYWSQPEILLYDEDANIRISYPDFIEDKGRYFVSETQKTVARIHEIDPKLLDGIWSQHELKEVSKNGLATDLSGADCRSGATFTMPRIASIGKGGGFTVDLWIRLKELTTGQVLLDGRDAAGKGLALVTSDRFTLKLLLSDGTTKFEWDTDPGTHAGTLRVNTWQHVAFVVDGASRIVSCMVDGILNDGGPVRQYGWTRVPKELDDVNTGAPARVAPQLIGEIRRLRVYDRYLRTSELVGNFRAGA